MKRKTIGWIGIALAVVLFCLGIFIRKPEKEINFISYKPDGYKEYVGGDAYNFIIEASLRGGEIAGAQAAQATYFSGAALTLMIGLLFLSSDGKAAPNCATAVSATAPTGEVKQLVEPPSVAGSAPAGQLPSVDRFTGGDAFLFQEDLQKNEQEEGV
jgi:hypothetical protein